MTQSYNILTHFLSSIRMFFFLLFFISIGYSNVLAADVNLHVGDHILFAPPNPPRSDAAINNCAWGDCGNNEFHIVTNSDHSATIYLDYDFQGIKNFQCTLYYYWYENGHQYNTHKSYLFTIRSLGNSGGGTPDTPTGSFYIYDIDQYINIEVGESHAAGAYTSSSDGTVTWFSSNPLVCKVYAAGNSRMATIVGVGKGATSVIAQWNGHSSSCWVTVSPSVPKTVTIKPQNPDVYCGGTKQLSATVSPSNAPQSVTWKIIEGNSDIATISNSGLISGHNPGEVCVQATANNGVCDTKYVKVLEPSLHLESTLPKNNATEVSVFINPEATFSHNIEKGNDFSSIALMNQEIGTNISGKIEIKSNKLIFYPNKPLGPQVNYTLTVPANAVKSKWGTHYVDEIKVNFKTGDYEKLILTSSNSQKFLSKGDKISLTANKASAKIYYTLNGSTPTENSTLYTGAITFENDIKLRAIAMGDGYENSEILSMDYYLTNVEVKGRYPDENTQLFVYEDVNPSLTFSNKIEASDNININSVSVLKNGKDAIEGEVIVADSTIYFVPDEPLELGCYYKVSVPQNAIVTWLGEENDVTTWTFSTGDFATAIAMGDEVSAAIKTDRSLLTWGEIYTSGNNADGSYVNESRPTPETFVSGDVASVSAGYMHNAIIKTDGTLWMWGRQYCGEFGNNSTTGSASPTKIMDRVTEISCGGQSSAIVKNDGSLWMVGRNDFGQIGDSTIMVRKSPVKIMDDVRSAVAGWCSSYAIKNDGTLMAWGRNDNGQLGDGTTDDRWEPTDIMNDVAIVSTSHTETNTAAAIKTDGSLWVWGNGNSTPQKVLDDVSSVSTRVGYITAIKNDGTMWKYSDGSTEMIAEGIADVQTNGASMLALKKDGSVWSGNSLSLTEKKVDGRSSSELAGLNLNRKTMRIAEGTRSVLVAKPIAINADYSTLTWESSNESVLEVSERGVLTANAIGETDVTVTIADSKGKKYTSTCHVSIVDPNDLDGIQSIVTEQQTMRAWANNNVLHISGLRVGNRVNVYDTSGAVVDTFIAEGENATRPLSTQGVYIVKSTTGTSKVLNR